MDSILEKGLVAVIAAGFGFTLQAIVYGERIASLERDIRILERLENDLHEVETLVGQQEFRTRSNRTFITRECHRNNIHDDALQIPRLNNCEQEF